MCPLFLASLLPIHFPWTILTSHPHLLEDNDTLSDLESHKLKMTQPPSTRGPDYHRGAEKCFSPPFILSLCWWIYFMWVRKKLILSMPLIYGDVLITAASSTGTNTTYHLAQLMNLCSWKHCLCSAFMTLHSSSFPSTFMIALSRFCWFFFIFPSKCWISSGSVLDLLLIFTYFLVTSSSPMALNTPKFISPTQASPKTLGLYIQLPVWYPPLGV